MSTYVIECMTAVQIVFLIGAIKYRSSALGHIIAKSLQKLNDPNPLSARHCFQRLCAFSAHPLFSFPAPSSHSSSKTHLCRYKRQTHSEHKQGLQVSKNTRALFTSEN